MFSSWRSSGLGLKVSFISVVYHRREGSLQSSCSSSSLWMSPSRCSEGRADVACVCEGEGELAVISPPCRRDEELLDGPGPRAALYGHGPLGRGR